MKLERISMSILQKSLDAVWLRQRVISNNIANIDTPGYKSGSVRFEDILSKRINGNYKNMQSLKKALDKTKPRVVVNEDTFVREDGNNVVIDKEQIELARAQLQYDYLISSLVSQLDRLKYAINGGR